MKFNTLTTALEKQISKMSLDRNFLTVVRVGGSGIGVEAESSLIIVSKGIGMFFILVSSPRLQLEHLYNNIEIDFSPHSYTFCTSNDISTHV